MATQKIQLVLPGGRYISGDHRNKRTTDNDNRPIAEDKQQFEFGVAVLKTAPGLQECLQQIWQYAASNYHTNAAVMQRINNQPFVLNTKQGGFSWKISDGDTPNSRGEKVPHAENSFIFWFAGSFPIKCCNAQNVEIDPSGIKRGDYVDVAMSVNVNGELGDRAGIYINPNIIRLLGYGPEIFGGLSPEQAFGAPATYIPQGASQQPVASGGMPGVGAQQPAQQMPGFTPPNNSSETTSPINPQTGQPVQPHHDFVMPGQGGQ